MEKKQPDLTGKCGTCKHYKPLVKNGKEFLRGACTYNGKRTYTTRTEKCRSHEIKEEEQ